MLRKTSLLFVLFAYAAFFSHAQSIDSLEKLIAGKNLSGRQRADALNLLSQKLIFVNETRAAFLAHESLELSFRNKYPLGQAAAYRVLSSIYSISGKDFISAEYIQRALDMFRAYNDSAGIANCYISMGHAFRKQNNRQAELVHHKKSFEIFSRLNIPERIGVTAHNLGESYFNNGDYLKCRELSLLAIKINDSLANLPVLSNCYKVIGKLEYTEGNYNKAENYFNRLLDISKVLGDNSQKLSTIEAMIYLAEIKGRQGDKRQQLILLKNAAGFSHTHLLAGYLQQIYTALIRYYINENDTQQAAAAVKEYNQVSESVTNRVLQQQADLGDYVISAYRFHENARKEAENRSITQSVTLRNKNNLLVILLVFALLLTGVISLLLIMSRHRKKTGELIRQSEEKYRRLFEMSLAGIYQTNAKGEILTSNRAFARMLGFTSVEELKKVKATDLYDTQAERDHFLEILRKEQQIVNNELRLKGHHGNTMHCIENVIRYQDSNGEEIFEGVIIDLTGLKTAEKELMQSREKYFSLINTVDGIVWEADAQTFRFNFVSREAEKLLGYPVDDWINNPGFWKDHIHEDDRNWAVEYCMQCTRDKKPHEFEYRMVAADGRTVWLRDIVTVLVENDKPVLLRGIMVDITEKKKTQTALEESEKKLRQVLSSMADNFYVVDRNYRVILINEKAKMNLAKAWGKPVDMGTNILDVIPEKSTPRVRQHFEKAFQGEQSEYELYNPNHGLPEWVSVSFVPVQDESSKIISVCVIAKDITERKKAEIELAESENRLRTIINNEPECIKLVSADGTLLKMNPAGLAMIEADSEEQVLGKNINSLVTPPYRNAFNKLASDVFAGKSGMLEFEIVGLKGTHRWLETHAVPLKNAEGKIIALLSVTRDVSERKKTAEELLREKTLSDSIINSLPGVFFLLDESGKYLRWNKNVEAISGFCSEEISRMHALDFIDEADKKNVADTIARVFEKGMAEVEANAITKNREIIPYYLNGWRVIVERRPCLIGIGIDISERKKTEAAIRKYNERFEMIAATTHDAIWEWNLETGEIWGNEMHQRLYGLTSSDPVPTEEMWKKRIHPGDREEVIQGFAEALASHKNVWLKEYRFLVQDEYKDIYDRTYIVRSAAGKPIRIMGSMMDITERKKAEIKFRDLLESAPDAMIIANENGEIVLVNHQTEVIFGYKKEELISKSIEILVPADSHKGHAARRARYFRNPKTRAKGSGLELFAVRKDGSKFPVEISLSPLETHEGKLVSAAIRDITQRKKAEEELRISEQRYRSLIEQASDAIMITDQIGNFLDVNSSFCEMFGYEKKELLKLNARDLIDPNQLKKEPLRFDKLLRGKHVFSHRRMLHKNGTIIEVEANVKMIPDGRIVAIARNITERIKTEQAIRNSEETRRLIMNSAMDAIIVMNTEGRVTSWNPQAERIFGWKEKEVVGKMLSDTIIPDHLKEKHKRGLANYLQTGKGPLLNKLIELTAVNRHGKEFPVELSIVDIKQGGEIFFCGFIRDISGRKQAEEKLKQSFEDIRRLASHLEKVREEERINIAREIHDELGQQLTVLKMDISWLSKKLTDNDPGIRQKIQELLKVIDHTVNTVRRISTELRPSILDDLGLVAALEWQSQEFKNHSGIKTKFVSKVDEVKIPVSVATTLFRIFQESLTNVARHAGATSVEAVLSMEKEKIRMTITDDGKGFYTDRIENKKTLGILGMRERATLMGGEYKIISTPGKGTQIQVTVPVSS
jgi:PAS domain S-box-containing protein